MDFHFGVRELHVPNELLSYICSFLDIVSDACAARLVNRAFSIAALPAITDSWVSPSLLFVKSDLSASAQSYAGTGIDPNNRDRWAPNPFTIWTSLPVPESATIGDQTTIKGKRFAELLCAPDKTWDDHAYTAFRQYGRKAVCWGRSLERPDDICIILQFDCRHSWSVYRDSDEAEALRIFLNDISPECIALSRSEHISISNNRRQRPLFEGYTEIRTAHFSPSMTSAQKGVLERTKTMYDSFHHVFRGQNQLGNGSKWWWLLGLRKHNNALVVVALFAFCWPNETVEKSYYEERAESDNPMPWHRDAAKRFEKELKDAGMIDSMSLHCNFVSGPWRN